MKAKVIKLGKLKSTTPQKIGRVILWIVIVFILIRGIASFVIPNNSNSLLKELDEKVKLSNSKTYTMEQAGEFAELFTREYFTYKQGATEEYRNRLSRYMGEAALSSITPSLNANVQALNSNVIDKSSYDTNSYDISVVVKVQYLDKNITKDIYVSVPVVENQGKYSIEDQPFLIPAPAMPGSESKLYEGTPVDSSISSSVQTMLNNFFKVYTEGTEGEINYYLSDPNYKIQGLNKNFKFKSIQELKVYSEANEFRAIVAFSVEDSETNQEIRQRINMKIINKENRYYIKEIENRSLNVRGGSKVEK